MGEVLTAEGTAELLCAVCGSDRWSPSYEGIDRFYRIEGSYRMRRCDRCGLLAQHPPPGPGTLKAHYPTDYYSYEASEARAAAPTGRWRGRLLWPLRKFNSLVYLRILGQDRDVPLPPGARVLDVGCGDGEYLERRIREGCEGWGVDIGRDALERLKRRCPSARTHCGELWEAGWPEGHFDLVNLCQTLEHVREPLRLLREVRRVTKPGGLVRVHVPNQNSWTRAIFGEHWIHLDMPRHLFVFSPGNLRRLFRDAGLDVVSTRTLENSFSVLGSWVYRDEDRTGRKRPLMSRRDVWDSELMKALLAPYCLLANLLYRGDDVEFILRRKADA